MWVLNRQRQAIDYIYIHIHPLLKDVLYHLSLGKGTTIAFASGRLLGDLLQQEATRSAAAKLVVLASNQDRWRVFFFFLWFHLVQVIRSPRNLASACESDIQSYHERRILWKELLGPLEGCLVLVLRLTSREVVKKIPVALWLDHADLSWSANLIEFAPTTLFRCLLKVSCVW